MNYRKNKFSNRYKPGLEQQISSSPLLPLFDNRCTERLGQQIRSEHYITVLDLCSQYQNDSRVQSVPIQLLLESLFEFLILFLFSSNEVQSKWMMHQLVGLYLSPKQYDCRLNSRHFHVYEYSTSKLETTLALKCLLTFLSVMLASHGIRGRLWSTMLVVVSIFRILYRNWQRTDVECLGKYLLLFVNK